MEDLSANAPELIDGFAADYGSWRLVFETELGVPALGWIGEGEEERRALRLVEKRTGEGVVIPKLPAEIGKAEDVTAARARTWWFDARDSAQSWHQERVSEDGIELTAEARTRLVEKFGEFYAVEDADWIAEAFENPTRHLDAKLAEGWEMYNELPEERQTLEHATQEQELAREYTKSLIDSATQTYRENTLASHRPELGSPEAKSHWAIELEGAERTFQLLFSAPLVRYVDEIIMPWGPPD